MESENKAKTIRVDNSGLFGSLWFAGWLFTLAFVQLVWWKALLAIIIWPYYLGLAVR